MNDRDVLIALSLAKGIGSRTMTSLLEAVDRPAELAPMSARDLRERAGITMSRARTVVDALRDGAAVERENKRVIDTGVRLVTLSDDDFPAPLRQIADPPVTLYVDGECRRTDTVAIAIVGARRATHHGIRMAAKLAGDLASVGFTIVSGMARGIDAAAHKGALGAGARTIAVTGCGLATVYPPEHDKLAARIAGNGAMVSEFPIDYPVLAENFPRRNRIISALSLGVIVVEASARSGSLITARLAAEQGREVFAMPGKAGSPSSRGTHRLIKDGAKLVDDVQDVLEEFPDVTRELLARTDGAADEGPDLERLGPQERALFSVLDTEPVDPESLAIKAELSIPDVLASLSKLAMLKLAAPVPGGSWIRNI